MNWYMNENNDRRFHLIHNEERTISIPVGINRAKVEKIVRTLNNHELKDYSVKKETLILEFEDFDTIEVKDVYGRESIVPTPTPIYKLGLDVHGVIDNPDHTGMFRIMAQNVIDNGGEVHLITGSSSHNREHMKNVKNLSVPYTHIFSITDYLLDMGLNFNEGSDIQRPWFPDEVWNPAKAEYCKRMKISVMYDDSEEYGNYFETPFLLWKK